MQSPVGKHERVWHLGLRSYLGQLRASVRVSVRGCGSVRVRVRVSVRGWDRVRARVGWGWG